MIESENLSSLKNPVLQDQTSYEAVVAWKDSMRSKYSEAEISEKLLSILFNIADAWNLSDEETMALLDLDSNRVYIHWKKYPQTIQLSTEELTRISFIFGIYKALQILFSKHEFADQWIKRPNKADLFDGKSAFQLMSSGRIEDLFRVRQFLDAQLI